MSLEDPVRVADGDEHILPLLQSGIDLRGDAYQQVF
jgi:hypothetical protein